MRALYTATGVYLIMHIAVMTKYAPAPEPTELSKWIYALEYLLPPFMIVLLVPRVQWWLNRVANVRVWTYACLAGVVACVATYFVNTQGRRFAWSTLGLLVLLVILVANTQRRHGNVSAWLLGGVVALLALGSWEILYQTGLLVYYDFFDMGMMSYCVTVAMQGLWIIPALIVILVLYQRGLRPSASRLTLTCLGVFAVATALWFATGMDIPLLWWQGPNGLEGPVVNEAVRPWLISASRLSQSAWLLGVASMFLHAKPRLGPYIPFTEEEFIKEVARHG